MSKIFIMSLLQVVLAQNIPNGRPYIRPNINTGRQFYFRNPDRNLEVHSQYMQLRNADFNNYRSYSPQNEENFYPHEYPNYQPVVDRRSAENNNEYRLGNGPETNHDSHGHHLRDESHISDKVSNSDQMHHRRRYHRKKIQSKATNEQETLISDVDSRPTRHDDNFDLITSEHSTKDNRQQRTTRVPVRTNENSTDNSDVAANKYIELTTVPVLLLMSVTLKTNRNIHSRFVDTEPANDSPAEVRHNSDSVTFSDIDNLKSDTSNKAATDNEVRFSKNETHGENEGDRWIWSDVTTANITTSTEMVLPDGGLDDRTSLNGDSCPSGQAKVKGICIPTH